MFHFTHRCLTRAEMLIIGGLVLLMGIASSPMYRNYIVRHQVSFAVHELSFLKKNVLQFLEAEGVCPTQHAIASDTTDGWHSSHIFDSYRVGGWGNPLASNHIPQCFILARFKTPETGHIAMPLRGRLIRYIVSLKGGHFREICSTNIEHKFAPEGCLQYQ